jgi:hypothetical protein
VCFPGSGVFSNPKKKYQIEGCGLILIPTASPRILVSVVSVVSVF